MKPLLQALLLVSLLLTTACEHQELCYNHNEHAHRYHVNVIADYLYDWEECYGGVDWKVEWPDHYMPYDDLRPTKPTGIRVINTNQDGKSNTHNIGADGGVVSLYKGVNNILFYNNDTEYILFSRGTHDATTRATTRTRSRASYQASKYANEGEETMTAPDVLYANYYEGHIAEKLLEPEAMPVTLQPLVYTYKVRYEFDEGLEYVAGAQGALTGMARSVTVNTGHTSEEAATILFDAEVTDYGVRAIVTSFGLPDYPHSSYPTRSENKNALNLELLLRNGRTVTFDFDVTDQMIYQPHGGVIVVKGISIKKDEGTQGEGAFDVEVNEWGDYEDVYLPI